MTWIFTASGTVFDLAAPKPEQVKLSDIAFALEHINRFNGHAGKYSVADHCVSGAVYLTQHNQLAAAKEFLVHDMHEAYTGDMSDPMKQLIGYDHVHLIEERIQRVLREALGLPMYVDPELAGVVKTLDESMRMLECEAFLGDNCLSMEVELTHPDVPLIVGRSFLATYRLLYDLTTHDV